MSIELHSIIYRFVTDSGTFDVTAHGKGDMRLVFVWHARSGRELWRCEYAGPLSWRRAMTVLKSYLLSCGGAA